MIQRIGFFLSNITLCGVKKAFSSTRSTYTPSFAITNQSQGNCLMAWKWTKRIGFGIVGAIAVLALAGALYQTISTKIDESKYPPIGQMVNVGGYRLHLNCQGAENSNNPTVILEAGIGCSSLDWSLVQPELAKLTRVCSYDRAGYGWSEESTKERTTANIVDELHTLLKKADVPGPYILVGHSLGGEIVRYYSSLYPDDVVGVLLVDSSHEEQRARFPKSVQTKPNKTLGTLFARLGVVRAFNTFSKQENSPFSEETLNIMQAHRSSTKATRAMMEEILAIEKSAEQLKSVGGDLKDKPLIVLSAGKKMTSAETGISEEDVDLINRVWEELQKDLVEKSTKGKQIIALNSGHLIPHEEPMVVIEAVKELLQKVSLDADESLDSKGKNLKQDEK